MKLPIALFLLCIVSVFVVSCGGDYTFEATKSINEKSWTYQDTVDFKVDIKDISKKYNIYMDIDYNTAYRFQNLYLNIYTLFPSGKRLKSRLNIDLAEASGKWKGECSGQSCMIPIILQERALFEEMGEYLFTVEQFTRTDSLNGITALNLKLEEVKAEK